MSALFSQRHKNILSDLYNNKELSLPSNLRVRIIKTIESYCEYHDHYELSSSDAESIMKKLLGLEMLEAFNDDNEPVESHIWEVIKRSYPHSALDAIEAFFKVLPKENIAACQNEINDALILFEQPWRLIDGKFFKLDSTYLAENALSQALELLNNYEFYGPLQEFKNAIEKHARGQINDCITSANKALESTIKAILGIKKGRPDELIKRIIDCKIIPSYYKGFLNSLKDILNIVPIQRHQPGVAHGQGQSVVELPTSLGELVLHLTGSLIVFLMKRYAELKAKDLESSLVK